MASSDKVFGGSIPQIYEAYLVPLIFEPYARDLATRLEKLSPQRVLETAAGTGVVTRALDARLPASVRIVATDLNRPMLDHARSRQGANGRISWQQADALALPFDDRSFDAVICQFGVMFFPDKIAGYRQARRMLTPGGRFIFSVWDKISENDFAEVVTDALAKVFPSDPPRFLARTPHGYHNLEQIRAELSEAGFTDIAIDAVDARSKAPSPRHPAIGYCEGTPLRNEIAARAAVPLEEARAVAAEAIARRFGSGPVDGRIRGFVITAGGD